MEQMTRYKIKLAVFFFVLFITGCTKKDELKLPVTIHFKIEFRQPVAQWQYGQNQSISELFTVEACHIGIRGIRLEGKREAGGDVFFETDPRITQMNLILTDPMDPVSIISFDIPQGIYDYMKCDIFLSNIPSDELIRAYNIDYEKTGIIIKGKYEKVYWTDDDFDSGLNYSIPFILAIENTEIFNISFSPLYDKGKIAIEHGKEYIALLFLDLYHVFKSISTQTIENAEVSGNGPDQVIIISGEKNKNLYENLLFRLAQSSTVIIY